MTFRSRKLIQIPQYPRLFVEVPSKVALSHPRQYTLPRNGLVQRRRNRAQTHKALQHQITPTHTIDASERPSKHKAHKLRTNKHDGPRQCKSNAGEGKVPSANMDTIRNASDPHHVHGISPHLATILQRTLEEDSEVTDLALREILFRSI